jgi:hypothetical protein
MSRIAKHQKCFFFQKNRRIIFGPLRPNMWQLLYFVRRYAQICSCYAETYICRVGKKTFQKVETSVRRVRKKTFFPIHFLPLENFEKKKSDHTFLDLVYFSKSLQGDFLFSVCLAYKLYAHNKSTAACICLACKAPITQQYVLLCVSTRCICSFLKVHGHSFSSSFLVCLPCQLRPLSSGLTIH